MSVQPADQQAEQSDFPSNEDMSEEIQAEDQFNWDAEDNEDILPNEQQLTESKGTEDRKASDEDSDKDSGTDEQESGEAEGEQEAQGQIDPKLLVQIGKMGLSDEDVDNLLDLGNSEAIGKALSVIESMQQAEDGGGEERQGQQEEAGELPEWYQLPEDLDERYDEEAVAVFKGMNEGTQKAVTSMMEHQRQALTEQFQPLIEGMMILMDQDRMSSMDEAVMGLDAEWQDILGNGYTDELDANSDAAKNRDKLREAVFSGEHKGSVKSRVERLSKSLFPDNFEKITRGKVVNKARDRQGRFIGRTSRKHIDERELSPTQRAIRSVASKMREGNMGAYGEEEMGEANDFI